MKTIITFFGERGNAGHCALTLVGVLAVLPACGPFDTVEGSPDAASDTSPPPANDAGRDASSDDGGDDLPAPVDAPRPLHSEEAPGAAWYDYDSRTRAVTPRPITWIAFDDATAHAIRLRNYYDDRGRSGFFRFDTRDFVDGAWSAPRSVSLSASVRETIVCFSFAEGEVPCEGAWDAVFHTEPRVLPTAGFTVRNPALSFRGHFVDPDATLRVFAHTGPDNALPSLTELQSGAALASSRVDPMATPVHSLLDAIRAGREVQQATTSFHFARWRVEDVDDRILFSAGCAPLAGTPSAQTSVGSPRELDVEVPEGFQVMVALCGEEGPTASDPMRPGARTLPVTDPMWDVVVERRDGAFLFRTVPGATARVVDVGAPVQGDLWDDA